VTQGLYYTVFPTDAGWMGVLGSDAGLRQVVLPRPSEGEVTELLGDIADAVLDPRFFDDLTGRFQEYFAGKRADFPDRLDLAAATPFQRAVWEAARLIPCGEVRSYGWVAGCIGKPQAARAVGQALGRNPLPVIVPCHRVLAGDGSLGGFSGGLAMKRLLLSLEKTS
jgi:methylated-DNA-[protein]-cysteine S-methyltransferase